MSQQQQAQDEAAQHDERLELEQQCVEALQRIRTNYSPYIIPKHIETDVQLLASALGLSEYFKEQ